ncbi:Acg family FMN-binding oxidoreductase [Streptomyces sp. 4N509B]|uniref:Acg family FMN-binding oxidoreductase n=1 Tax=Streptomyces sp. 4N509B TaxID=3457413 RepID=UPI003FCEEE1A
MQSLILDTPTVTSLVRAATAAPSLHNAQPWRFRFLTDSVTFQVRASLDRALPREDPHGRALHMGCAAALLNLRVAAAHAGWLPLTALLPDPYDPRLLATVRLERPLGGLHPEAVPDTEPGPEDLAALAALHPAIRRRHTCRQPFREEPVPVELRAALCQAAGREGARLRFPEPDEAWRLLETSRDAEGRDLAPFTTATTGAPSPNLAVIGTTEDRSVDWLRTGQAMERALLLAAGHGLTAVLTCHTPGWHEPHAPDHPQAMIRFGYAPASPATPRRPTSLVLDIV